MAAVVTDQFRILNASNFVESIADTENAYYVFLGLTNPTEVGFGRSVGWDSNPPSPIDNLNYLSHYRDTSIFGKRITGSNVRRIVRKNEWSANIKYEMYRHDYSILNQTPITKQNRLYDANYYVINSDYRVYICIDNGSSGINPSINGSLDEPKFTDVEPSPAGESGDGYIWKYLFTISPSDVIKFDSTEYIVVPNDWTTTIIDSEIVRVRENGNSTANNNQIKKVYIENGGIGYSSGTCNILGDGTGGKVLVETENGVIVSTTVVSGGSGYTYGIVDLGSVQPSSISSPAKLIPIIPPSKGHGYDIYTELGTDKVLIYARFDDSTKDFPTDTTFSQIGILKNPTTYSGNSIFKDNQYSSLYSIKLSSGTPTVGDKITQTVSGGTARGYVASYDSETQVLKYYQDRSLFFGSNSSFGDQTDYNTVSNGAEVLTFSSSGGTISPFSGSIDTTFGDPTPTNKVISGNKVIDLGATFTKGLANPEINKSSGDIIYIDNRAKVSRSLRQKEDIKIILEF